MTRRIYASLEAANVRRLGALLTLLDVEFNFLIFLQVPVTGALDSREVCEYIGGAIIWGDEAVALVGVEPFDCACGHNVIPYFLVWDHECDPLSRDDVANAEFVGQHCARYIVTGATRYGCSMVLGEFERSEIRVRKLHATL